MSASSVVNARVVAIAESARYGVGVGVGGIRTGVGVMRETGFAVILWYIAKENILKRKRNKKNGPQTRNWLDFFGRTIGTDG